MTEITRRLFLVGAVAASFLGRPHRPKPRTGVYSNTYSNTY